MIITFLGHRSLFYNERLFQRIQETILEYIKSDEKMLFYCGGYGDFDHLCVKACRLIQKKALNCEIVFVTPYMISSKPIGNTDITLYDSVLYPPLEKVPPRFAISRRNEWMIDQADLIIAYVKYSHGGAYTGMKYAKRKQKTMINLAEEV